MTSTVPMKAAIAGAFAALIFSTLPLLASDPLDWPHWRGPEWNGISRETGLVDSWSPKTTAKPDGENLLWQRDDLGGISTPIVMRGKLYMLMRNNIDDKAREGEKVVCLDAATGKTLWENEFNVFLSDVPHERVAWSSVVGDPETGNVFALGVCGLFQCINGETGKTLWSHSMSEEYGLLSTFGGRTNFPMVDGNLVIISSIVIGWGDMAKPAHRFIAFDKRNGATVWFESTRLLPFDTTYSSPVMTVFNKQRALLFGSGDGGLHAFQPQTGKSIWRFYCSKRGLNLTPVVIGDMVLTGHNEENLNTTSMGALIAIDGTGTGDVTETNVKWQVLGRKVNFSQPMYVNGLLYVVDDSGGMMVLNPKDGSFVLKRKKIDSAMRGSMLYADGKFYTCTANGRWYILKPTEKGVDIVHRLRLKSKESAAASPIVSHGRIYLHTSDALYCIGKKDHQPAATAIPPAREFTPVSDGDKPALLQLVPVDSLLRSGQTQSYQVRLYNERGQFLRLAEPKLTLDGPGKVDGNGVFTATNDKKHSAAIVTAKFGDLTATARVRTIPALPWSFDFNDGEIPVTWVGMRYRHIAVDFDLYQKLDKASPLAGASYLFAMTGFINSGRPALTYDDTTPKQGWTVFMRYLGLLNDAELDIQSLDAVRKVMDPALDFLEKEKVISKREWAMVDLPDVGGQGVQLKLTRGPRKVDGNGVMVKVKTIPKGARSQGWMGHPGLHDYTIQADVMSLLKDDKLPDIGLTGQRYTLDMMGLIKGLQIRSWPTEERMAKTIDHTFKPLVWYTMKLRIENKDDKALLYGKVWPRDEAEPKEWMVEAVDDAPNKVGSPGLYGNAIDSEIFFDNIKVTPN